MTDDLHAAAIDDAFGYDEAVVLALEAGNDLLLFANQQEGLGGRCRTRPASAPSLDSGSCRQDPGTCSATLPWCGIVRTDSQVGRASQGGPPEHAASRS